MADLIWGHPLEGGETVPGTKHPWAYKVSTDGTRRIEPHTLSILAGIWTTGISLKDDEPVPAEAAGYIPSNLDSQSEGYVTRKNTLTAEQGEAGYYVHFPNPGGSCPHGPEGGDPRHRLLPHPPHPRRARAALHGREPARRHALVGPEPDAHPHDQLRARRH